MPPAFNSKGWDGEVAELLSQITPTAEVDRIVNQVAQMMGQTIRPTVPEIQVAGFASGNLTCGTAFGVAVPDVDVIVSVSPQILFHRLRSRNAQAGSEHERPDARKLQKSALRIFTDQLVAVGFKFRRSGFKGEEPKVTLLVPQSFGLFADSFPVSFSVNVVTPFYNAALLAACGKMDVRAKDLILLVKRWAKDRAICHTPKGHLSPYMWGILTIFFLQVHEGEEGPVLPSLDNFEMSPGLLSRLGGESLSLSSSNNLKSAWKPPQCKQPEVSASTLFKAFVCFFSEKFDWHNEAVSIRLGRRAATCDLKLPVHVLVSAESGASQVGPSIEDPFQAANNLADCMTAASLARLKEEFSRAQQLCMRTASLSELLAPWAPDTSEATDTM
jgi:hypothetical protein